MGRVAVSTSSFGRHDPGPLERLREAGHEVTVNPHGRRLEPAESRELLRSVDGLIAGTERLDRDILAAAPRLRVISRCGVGTDAIDLDAAAALGIRVAHTTRAHVDPVAELALGGILDLLRHLAAADRALRGGAWEKPMGRLLRGKQVGVIGLGRTGRRLVELLVPFECGIRAVDPVEDPAYAAAMGITYGPLDAVLEASDVVSLHLDYSPAVRHLIGRRQIGLMKEGAILVNTARGGLVDEPALAAALEHGTLGGAFLDVFEREPYDGPLAHLENVLLSPHIGSYAVEGRIAMETEAVDNLLSAMAETA